VYCGEETRGQENVRASVTLTRIATWKISTQIFSIETEFLNIVIVA
jgi:hypothetical protein